MVRYRNDPSRFVGDKGFPSVQGPIQIWLAERLEAEEARAARIEGAE